MAKQGFSKASRLLGSSQFSPVFKQAEFKLSSASILILANKSKIAPRLGIVVAKKHVNSAVQRNRIKRLIRESFRLRQKEFGTIDMVVLAKQGLEKMNNQEIQAQLNLLFDGLLRKLNKEK